jgi:EpsI family protein
LGSGGGEVLANEFLLQRGGEQRMVLYWYMSYGATTPSFMQFRYHLLRNRVLRRPMWGALIRVSAPIAGSQEEAAQASEDLLREIHPNLREELKI